MEENKELAPLQQDIMDIEIGDEELPSLLM